MRRVKQIREYRFLANLLLFSDRFLNLEKNPENKRLKKEVELMRTVVSEDIKVIAAFNDILNKYMKKTGIRFKY